MLSIQHLYTSLVLTKLTGYVHVTRSDGYEESATPGTDPEMLTDDETKMTAQKRRAATCAPMLVPRRR